MQSPHGGFKVEIPIKTLREIEDWFGFTLPTLPKLTNDFKDCRFGDGKKKNKKDYSLCKAGKGFKAFNWKTGDKKFFACEEHDFKESVPKYKPQSPKTCETEFNQLSKAVPENHPYLHKKQISVKNLNIRYHKGNLYIPVLFQEKIVSWQQITNEGDKWFKPGHKLPAGHYFHIGKNVKGKIYLCEGVATGASIFQITGAKVFCSFSKANLDNVAKMLLKRYQKNIIVMACDNDGKNTWKTEVKDKRLEVVFPDLPGDFNDHQKSKKEQNKLLHGERKIPKEVKMMRSALSKLGYRIRYNDRSNKTEIYGFTKGKWEDMNDEIRSFIYLEITEIKDFQKLKKLAFEDRLKAIAVSCKEDPFKTYLEKIIWDKTPRLKKFLFECFNIEGKNNIALAEWAFQSILLGCVTRTFRPGSKHDEFIVFKGQQGLGKSSLFAKLLENQDFFTNSISFSSQQKEIVENIQGKVLCEFSELSGFRKFDIDKLKNLISTPIDNARLSYRRDSAGYPRKCIFIGSTNDLKPLPCDLTGMRRFVVIELKEKIKFEAIIKKVKEERNQLWGEAVHLYKEGKSARLPKELWEISAEVAEEHRSGDTIFEQKFMEKINGQREVVLGKILKEMKDGVGEGKDARDKGWITNMSPLHQSQAKEILNKLGYKETRPMKNGIRQRIWVNESVTNAQADFTKKADDELYFQAYGEIRDDDRVDLIKLHEVEAEKPPIPDEKVPF